jgi:hypothetical protein
MIQAIQAQPIKGYHVGIYWIHDVINPWEEDPMNQEPLHMHHMDPMAHLHVQTSSNPRGHPKPP